VWRAHFYFWSRIVYAILYTLARSLVWNIPTIGMLTKVAGLFVKRRSGPHAQIVRATRIVRASVMQEFGCDTKLPKRDARPNGRDRGQGHNADKANPVENVFTRPGPVAEISY
jgi:hypothetical protein